MLDYRDKLKAEADKKVKDAVDKDLKDKREKLK